MNIAKAIEVKEAYHKRFSVHMLSNEREADRLSIEALKRQQQWKDSTPAILYNPLPGETKD